MPSMSTYMAQKTISHALKNTAYTSPSPGIYLALATTDLTADNVTAGEMSSVTHTWYARQQISSWTAPSGSGISTSNSNAVSFAANASASVSIGFWGLYDALTAGNLLAYGSFDTAKTAEVGNIVKVAANELVVSFAGDVSVYLAQKMLNLVFSGTAYTPPAGQYLALYTADPTALDVTSNEVQVADWAAYSRQSLLANRWASYTGAGNFTSNLDSFAFSALGSGESVAITHAGIRDASSGGNLLFFGDTVESLTDGDVYSGNAGDIVVSIS